MRNILRVLRRDFIRLIKAPAALVVVVALLILPSAYTWYNVVGFWNPYENTASMRVAVVNQDNGATSELTGNLNVGNMIEEQLAENDQLDWVFCDYDTAMGDVKSGKDFAAFVIPSNFSENLLSMTTGNFTKPNIQYYVNEKAGPVAPKVTDSGSSTLERTINSEFVKTVSDAVVLAMTDAVDESKTELDAANSEASVKVRQAVSSISEAQQSLREVDSSIALARSKASEALGTLDEVESDLDEASGDLAEVSAAAKDIQTVLPGATSAALEDLNKALALLQSLPWDVIGVGKDDVEQAITLIEKAIEVMTDEATSESIKALEEVSATAAELSVTLNAQKIVLDQTRALLNQLDNTLSVSQEAIGQTSTLLGDVSTDIQRVYDDVQTLSQSSLITRLAEEGHLDADRISEFMGAPTTLESVKLFPVNAYGSAMSPLFLNLSFWIGAFCLLVIMRQEVDDEGIMHFTLYQRYLSRFLLFAIFVILQSIICCAGCLFIGVRVANIPAFFVGAAVASLSYLSIIYALSTVLQHIGKGLCIVLVFVQIPAATGLYPIEMTAPFYQAISPIFPFTYGIGAMREAICGFYGTSYAYYLAMLALFFVVFMLLGLFVRPLMSNVNRMTANQIRESGLFNGENVDIPERKSALAQFLAATADASAYKEAARRRYEKMEEIYPKMIRAAAIAGVVVPVVATVVLTSTAAEKVVLLTVWLVWVVILFVFLVVVETIRHNIRRDMGLDEGEEAPHA